jgi:hypothetical protein
MVLHLALEIVIVAFVFAEFNFVFACRYNIFHFDFVAVFAVSLFLHEQG